MQQGGDCGKKIRKNCRRHIYMAPKEVDVRTTDTDVCSDSCSAAVLVTVVVVAGHE